VGRPWTMVLGPLRGGGCRADATDGKGAPEAVEATGATNEAATEAGRRTPARRATTIAVHGSAQRSEQSAPAAPGAD
jgi:hypothetical protein